MTKETSGGKRAGSNPAALRRKAQQLLQEAERLENETLIKIGKLALKYCDTDFNDLAKFKKEIDALKGPLGAP